MDQNSTESAPTSQNFNASKGTRNPLKFIRELLTTILALSFLIILVIIGLIYFKILDVKQLSPVTTLITNLAIQENKLPVSLSLLQNPIVYEWAGSVEGKITAKDGHSFVIEDGKGSKITIKITNVVPGSNTVFNTLYFDNIKGKPTTLDSISLGRTLRGTFYIFKDYPDTPIGGSFEVIK